MFLILKVYFKLFYRPSSVGIFTWVEVLEILETAGYSFYWKTTMHMNASVTLNCAVCPGSLCEQSKPKHWNSKLDIAAYLSFNGHHTTKIHSEVLLHMAATFLIKKKNGANINSRNQKVDMNLYLMCIFWHFSICVFWLYVKPKKKKCFGIEIRMVGCDLVKQKKEKPLTSCDMRTVLSQYVS